MAESSPISSFVSISFNGKGAKVKSFVTASRTKSTIIKIEIEATNSWELQDSLRQLHAAQHPGQDEIL
jgi:hypothetical protein